MRTRVICVVNAEPLTLEGYEGLNLCVHKDLLESTYFAVTERWTGMQIARSKLQSEAVEIARKRVSSCTPEQWAGMISKYKLPPASESELQVSK